jgi:hypothetical protein
MRQKVIKMGNSKKLTEGDEINGLNVVVVEGVVKQEPTLRELGDGEFVREFTVGTYIDGRQVKTPVVCREALGASLSAGDEVTIVGHVHMRFFATGGRVTSRTEVVAKQVFGARSRSARTKALAGVIQVIQGR